MRTSALQRLTSLLLLLAYAISGTAMVPAVIALVAGMEGSHAVQVTESAQGVQVTLHHTQQSGYTPRVADHDTAVARLLVSLSNRSERGDHQIIATESRACASVESTDQSGKAKESRLPIAIQSFPATGPAHHLLMVCVSSLRSMRGRASANVERIRTVQMLM